MLYLRLQRSVAQVPRGNLFHPSLELRWPALTNFWIPLANASSVVYLRTFAFIIELMCFGSRIVHTKRPDEDDGAGHQLTGSKTLDLCIYLYINKKHFEGRKIKLLLFCIYFAHWTFKKVCGPGSGSMTGDSLCKFN